MRCRDFDASSAREELLETRENDHVSIAFSRVSFQSSIKTPRGEFAVAVRPTPSVASSLAFKWAVTLNSPWRRISRPYAVQLDGMGCRASNRLSTGRKPGDSGTFLLIRLQSAALSHSHRLSAHGNGKRTSCTDKTQVCPNMKLCWASMMNPKKAVRFED